MTMSRNKTRRSARRQRGRRSVVNRSIPPGVTSMKFSRTYAGGVLSKGTNDAGQAFQYNITLAPDVTSLLNVFDAYRIDYVDHHFTYVADTPAASAIASYWPVMAYAIDYDDDNVPGTYQSVLQSNLHKLHFFTEGDGRTVTVRIRPRAAAVVTRGSVSSLATGWAPDGQIIDAAFPDAPHYGLKAFILNYNLTTQPNSRIFSHSTIHFTMYAAKTG